MKKRIAKILVLLFMSLTFLTACQKAPEVSDDDEILRAKGPSEDAVEAVVNGEEEGSSETLGEAAYAPGGMGETAGRGTKAVSKDMEAGDSAFSLQDAKALLTRKLSLLGIEDIHLSIAHVYGQDGFLFYEMQFSPVVEGIPVADSFGQQDVAEVYPDGFAWVCEEGVVDVGVWNCCMEQMSEIKNGKILSFSKVQELLEIYLDDGSLQCAEDVPFSTAELVYYVERKDGKLELAPMWSIHMDLEEYVEYVGQTGRSDLVWNIYIDAVTGKLAGAE